MARSKRRGSAPGRRRRPEARDRHPGRGRPDRDLRDGEVDDGCPASTSRPRRAAAARASPTSTRSPASPPGEVARRAGPQEGRPQRARPDHHAAPGRRPQAPLPRDRLQAQTRTACRPRSRASSTTPTASARIALLHYADGEKRYILAPQRPAQSATRSMSGAEAEHPAGNALPLRNIPVGTVDPRRSSCKPGRGRQDGALGGRRRPADGEGRHVAHRCGCPPARSRLVARATARPPSA